MPRLGLAASASLEKKSRHSLGGSRVGDGSRDRGRSTVMEPPWLILVEWPLHIVMLVIVVWVS